MADEKKTKYIEPSGLGDINKPSEILDIPLSLVDSFGEGGSVDKGLGWIAEKIGKAPGKEGEDLLKLFNSVIGVPELLMRGAIQLPQLLAYPAFALQWAMANGAVAKQKIKEILKSKELTAEEREAILKLAMEMEQREFVNEYINSNGNTSTLLDSQSQMISQSFDFGNEATLNAFQQQNLAGVLDVRPDEIDNLDLLNERLKRRKRVHQIVNTLLTSQTITGPLLERISKIVMFMENGSAGTNTLNPEEILFLTNFWKFKNEKGEEIDGSVAAAVLRELIRVFPLINSGIAFKKIYSDSNIIINFLENLSKPAQTSGESDTELLNDIDSETQRTMLLQQFLTKYKRLLTIGEGFHLLTINDDLSMAENMPEDLVAKFNSFGIPGGRNPFLNLGFLDVPNSDQLEIKRSQLRQLRTDLPKRRDFLLTFQSFYQLHSKDEIKKNLNLIRTLPRNMVEALDSLSTILIDSRKNREPGVRIAFQGEEIYLQKNSEVYSALMEVLQSASSSGNVLEGININPKLLSQLVENLWSRPEFRPLVGMLLQLQSVLPFQVEGVLGNRQAGYNNSLLKFITDLNTPADIFKYLYIYGDGDLLPLDKMSAHEAAAHQIVILSNLTTKADIARRLIDFHNNGRNSYNMLADAHYDHWKLIVNGGIELPKNKDKGGDHMGYIAQLSNVNTILVNNIKTKQFEGLANSAAKFNLNENIIEKFNYVAEVLEEELPDIEVQFDLNVAVSRLDNPKKPETRIERLQIALSTLGKVLQTRLNEIIAANDADLIEEFNLVYYHLSILKALGFNPNLMMLENSFNKKKFNMYLNGYDIKISADSFGENSGRGMFALEFGGNRMNLSAFAPEEVVTEDESDSQSIESLEIEPVPGEGSSEIIQPVLVENNSQVTQPNLGTTRRTAA